MGELNVNKLFQNSADCLKFNEIRYRNWLYNILYIKLTFYNNDCKACDFLSTFLYNITRCIYYSLHLYIFNILYTFKSKFNADFLVFFAEKQRYSLCVGCGAQNHDQYILRVAPDLEWHAACLKCQECRQFLDESCTCFVRDGKTYCKRDYVR